jgi:hypothetical protein
MLHIQAVCLFIELLILWENNIFPPSSMTYRYIFFPISFISYSSLMSVKDHKSLSCVAEYTNTSQTLMCGHRLTLCVCACVRACLHAVKFKLEFGISDASLVTCTIANLFTYKQLDQPHASHYLSHFS